MACYIVKPRPASRADYQVWLKLGYRGDYERYALSKRYDSPDDRMFICGDLGPHCTECLGIGELLCDYPVGEGKTCDRPLCPDHAHHVLADTDYCADHHAEWLAFKETNVQAALAAAMPLPAKPGKAANND